MNSSIKYFLYLVTIPVIMFSAGCEDNIAPEITELELSRLLSPTNLDARVVNKTSARLNWNPVRNASTYTVEFYENPGLDFTGTPIKTVSDISYDQVPIVVEGFAGETTYSLRVKAIGASIPESSWITAIFTTDQEQIFLPVDPEGITSSGLTLSWPAGETATSILFTPGDISHTVTADEVAAGVAVITGLLSETTYTAKLLNNSKTRGTITFTTLIDLGGAIAVHPEDDLNAAITAALNGDVLVLFPGVYAVYQGDIIIDKSITVKGLYPHNKPLIFNRFVFSAGVVDAAFTDLEMVGTIEGVALKTTQAFFFNPGTYDVNSVLITGCVIRDYNQALIYGGSAVTKVQTLTIHNCVASNIVNDGGDFIDFRTGHVVNLTLTNSTFNRVAAFPRDFIRLDNSSTNFPGSVSTILIDHCTFYQVSNSRRILYVRFNQNASTVSNTIFAGADASYSAYYTNQSSTTQPVCLKNNYFNASKFLGDVTNGKFDISATHTTLDPGFANPEAGDFKVSNEDLKLFGIGDPRWLQ
jgi:hypothetical protein